MIIYLKTPDIIMPVVDKLTVEPDVNTSAPVVGLDACVVIPVIDVPDVIAKIAALLFIKSPAPKTCEALSVLVCTSCGPDPPSKIYTLLTKLIDPGVCPESPVKDILYEENAPLVLG
jgi:hypothetical protein